jgi:CO/xanthine dehydrogenase FAD-binding subunit
MKPASFEYARPADLDQACAMLAAGDDARIIAGGQTLVPLMAMRLARPKRLIDIARIPDLAFVRHERDGIAIGATTRQCVLERDAVVRAAVPLLAKVMPFVGHAAIRSRGTGGGRSPMPIRRRRSPSSQPRSVRRSSIAKARRAQKLRRPISSSDR